MLAGEGERARSAKSRSLFVVSVKEGTMSERRETHAGWGRDTARDGTRAGEQMYNAAGFAQFWQRYPKRVGRLAVIREWNKLKPDAGLVAHMLETLAWQIRSEQWRRGYVPDPRTWLYQGRWMDENPERVMAAAAWNCKHQPHCGSEWRCHQRTQLDAARLERGA